MDGEWIGKMGEIWKMGAEGLEQEILGEAELQRAIGRSVL